MKITILCNNSVKTFSECIAEHGFAAYLETDDGNYLFDTGVGYGIVKNAGLLNKDLHNVKALILSHGHLDHCGGLEKVLRHRNSTIPIYAHPNVFLVRYADSDGKKIFDGIPFRQEFLESLGADFKFITDFTQIAKDLYITGEVKRRNSFELPEKDLLVKSANSGEFEVDPILDDYSLAINTSKGIVLLLGCAHSGLENIMSHLSEKLNIRKIYAIIGGTHLVEADDIRIKKTIEALEKFQVQKIGTCHCTGPEKEATLKTEFGDRFFFAQVGCEFII